MMTASTFDQKQRRYDAPRMELAEMPLNKALCEFSGDLEDIVEEDGGITWD